MKIDYFYFWILGVSFLSIVAVAVTMRLIIRNMGSARFGGNSGTMPAVWMRIDLELKL